MTLQKEYPVMVSVRCLTYNHVKYIRQCLEGIVKQQTSFPFEAIVHDDASTDGTTEIVREFAEKYPDIIKPLYEKENLWSKHDGALKRIVDSNLRGKYITPCDGDDCWLDPFKLQKQVDFLENNPDYTLIHTGFSYINVEGIQIAPPDISLYKDMTKKIKNGFIWHYLLTHSSFIMFSTIMYRADVFKKEFTGIDHGMFLSCARQGKIHYLPDVTTSYRILQSSFMRTDHDRIQRQIENACFRQLYYFTSNEFYTNRFYRHNVSARIAIAEGILSTLAHYSDIKGERKGLKLLYILFSRPFNIVLLPVALVLKLFRRIK